MKKYLLILLVVINLKVKSQETIIRVHKITDELICQGFVLKSDSSIYHGAFAMFFEGKKIAVGNYSMGKKSGKWTRFYPNGNPSQIGFFVSDLKHGKWQYFYQSGELASTIYYIRNNKEAKWIGYYKNGNKSAELNFKNNNPIGEQAYYYNNGQIAFYSKVDSINPRKIIVGRYFENNNLFESYTMLNNEFDGEYKRYFLNGVLKDHFVFERGNLKEVIESNNIEGFKLDIGTFKNGNGLLKRFDEKEEVISEVNYENGIKEGEAFFYDSDGHLRTKGFYLHDKPTGTWSTYLYTPKPKLYEEISYLCQGLVRYKKTETKGMGFVEGFFLNETAHGEWKKYNYYGELESSRSFRKGNYHGPVKIYKNNAVIVEGQFAYGDSTGNWTFFYPNGKVNQKVVFNNNPYIDSTVQEQHTTFRIEEVTKVFGTFNWISFRFKDYFSNNIYTYPKLFPEFEKSYDFYPITYPPAFAGIYNEFVDYFLRNLVEIYKDESENLKGNLGLEVEIDEFGEASKVFVRKGLGNNLDEMAKKMTNYLPYFEPKLVAGIPQEGVLKINVSNVNSLFD